jgi:hypothetical protein
VLLGWERGVENKFIIYSCKSWGAFFFLHKANRIKNYFLELPSVPLLHMLSCAVPLALSVASHTPLFVLSVAAYCRCPVCISCRICPIGKGIKAKKYFYYLKNFVHRHFLKIRNGQWIFLAILSVLFGNPISNACFFTSISDVSSSRNFFSFSVLPIFLV